MTKTKKFNAFLNENSQEWFSEDLVNKLKEIGHKVSRTGDKVEIAIDWSIDVDNLEVDNDLERPVYADFTITLSQDMTFTYAVSAYHKETDWTFSDEGSSEDFDPDPEWIADEVNSIISEYADDKEILDDLEKYLNRYDEEDEDE